MRYYYNNLFTLYSIIIFCDLCESQDQKVEYTTTYGRIINANYWSIIRRDANFFIGRCHTDISKTIIFLRKFCKEGF